MQGGMRVRVARSPTETFEFLADIRNERAWNPRLVRIEKTSPGPVAAGTTFRGTYQGLGELETELVDYDPPRRLSFRSRGPRMAIHGAFALTPADGGTDVNLVATFEPRGVFRPLAPLMALVLRRQNEAAAHRLAQALRSAA